MHIQPSLLYLLLFIVPISTLAQQNKQIETITVSANRQAVKVGDITSNIAWIDEEQLVLIAPQHIQQSLVRVAGAWISRGNGQEHLTALRSPVLTGAGSCGAFFMAEDGISLRAPGFCNANQLFDANSEQAARIEVVNGANSALYGSNAVHGVINIISPDAWQASPLSLNLETGPHQYLRGKFSVSHANNTNAWLLYGNLTHDGGYQQDSGFDQQKINLIHQTKLGLWQVKNLVAISKLNQQTAGFVEGFEAYKNKTLSQSNANPEAYRNAKSLMAYSQLSLTTESGALLNIKPYVRSNDMAFLQHYLPWQAIEKNGHNSVGMQATYSQTLPGGTLLSGFDWDQSWGDLSEFQPNEFSAAIPQGMHYDYAVKSRIYSPFIQLNWQLSTTTTLLAASRYEHSELDYNNHLTDGVACASLELTCRFVRPADQVLTFQHWSHKLALNQQISNNTHVYAQWAEGYRVPQTSELFRLQNNQSQSGLKPEQSEAFEFGLRGNWANTYLDANGFYLKKQHVILQDTDRQIINNGSTSHTGIEITLRQYFSPEWYFSTVTTYAKHRYDSAQTISRQDISGNEIDTAPQHMGSAQLGWRSQRDTVVELEWVHMGQYYLDPENSVQYQGHDLINLRASLPITEQLTFALRLLNLSNQDYAERADIAFGNYRYFVGEPRSAFASINWTW